MRALLDDRLVPEPLLALTEQVIDRPSSERCTL
jgi:hypothetical protein